MLDEDDIEIAQCVGFAAGPGTEQIHALRLIGLEGVQQLPYLCAGLIPRLFHCLIHVSNVAALHHTPRRLRWAMYTCVHHAAAEA